jgi:hypothetical protein
MWRPVSEDGTKERFKQSYRRREKLFMANFSYNRLIIEGNDQEVGQFVTSFTQDLFTAHVGIPDPAWKDAWKLAIQGNPHNALPPGFSEWMKTHWGVNAHLTETKDGVEEMPDAEALRDWFASRFGGFPGPRPPETKVVALSFETAWLPPVAWAESVINQFDGKLSIAMYSINPNDCSATITRRRQEVYCAQSIKSDATTIRDDTAEPKDLLYWDENSFSPNGVAITMRGDTTNETEFIYQVMVRQFGFTREQFAWKPDCFYGSSPAGAKLSGLDETEIRAEHEWVLRGRGEGDGYPQYFNIMTRYLPQKWFDHFYWDERPYTVKSDHDIHEIKSLGLSNLELKELQRAETASAVSRIMSDPAYKVFHRAVLEVAVRDGQLERFEAELRAPERRIACFTSSNTLPTQTGAEGDHDDFFSNLAKNSLTSTNELNVTTKHRSYVR